jgi:hypothetical protein
LVIYKLFVIVLLLVILQKYIQYCKLTS